MRVIAEGIESLEECLTLADQGVELFQGYYFAKPAFEALPPLSDQTWEILERRAGRPVGKSRQCG